MSLSQITSRLLQPVNKRRGLAYAFGLLSATTATATYHFRANAAIEEAKATKAVESLQQNFSATEISGTDTINFPWTNDMKNWEYKLVKMRGYFEPERIFVRKTKDGNPGFLVFAPFVTALALPAFTRYEKVGNGVKACYGIWVNLGWVPVGNALEIENTREPLENIDTEHKYNYDYTDPATGFRYLKMYNEDYEEKRELTEVTGVIRKGDEYNPFIGNSRSHENRRGNINYINLKFMTRFRRFANPQSCKAAYLERIVESLDEEDASVYPIPATPTTLTPDSLNAETYRSFATYTGVVSGLGLGAIVPLLLL